MDGDFVDFLLSDFRKKPGMYLGSYSLSGLSIFSGGFMVACQIYEEAKGGFDRFYAFLEWFNKRHSVGPVSTWTWPFLKMVDDNEKAALDLFFSELEVYISKSNR